MAKDQRKGGVLLHGISHEIHCKKDSQPQSEEEYKMEISICKNAPDTPPCVASEGNPPSLPIDPHTELH